MPCTTLCGRLVSVEASRQALHAKEWMGIKEMGKTLGPTIQVGGAQLPVASLSPVLPLWRCALGRVKRYPPANCLEPRALKAQFDYDIPSAHAGLLG